MCPFEHQDCLIQELDPILFNSGSSSGYGTEPKKFIIELQHDF
jgi:hypothetical protein